MNTLAVEFQPDLKALSSDAWLYELGSIADEHGYYEPVGPRHHAALVDAGKDLIVTFQSLEEAQKASPENMPLGWSYTLHSDWSSLVLLSEGDTWFRDPSVYGYFDRLIDDGFFDEFRRVLFVGTGPAGYAACAYSVAAPGARVLAIRPQATLDARITGWDQRFASERRRSFSTRYGFAPSMLDAADHAWIVADPHEQMDAMHASLFVRDHVDWLAAPHLGPRLETSLAIMRILDPMIRGAMAGTLSPSQFSKLFQARRIHPAYLTRLLAHVERQGHFGLAKRLCEYAVAGPANRPHFRTKLEELSAAASDRG